MPTVLTALTSTSLSLDPYHADSNPGFYAAGAYTASPPDRTAATGAQADEEDIDPQEAYYSSLLSRFVSLSKSLQTPPPITTAPILLPSTSATVQPLNSGSNSRWRTILNTKPSMLLLHQLSQEAVLQGLRMLQKRLTIQNLVERDSLGLWAWGLLGRCRDVGEMDSEGIGVVRELGKKAIWVLRGMQAGDPQGADYGEDEGEDDSGAVVEEGNEEASEAGDGSDPIMHDGLDAVEPSGTAAAANDAIGSSADAASSGLASETQVTDQLEAAKAQMLASLPPELIPPNTGGLDDTVLSSVASAPEPSSNDLHNTPSNPDPEEAGEQMMKIYATLDMIITIVGECYGQRDLLEGRIVWGELEEYGI